jgi:uncharacterized protein YecE (DUF72 family)
MQPDRMPGKVRVGCSGWSYATWRPAFYPDKTPLKKLLQAYAALLPVVEVNYTFRSLPSNSTVENWLDQTPASFQFSLKAPQRITHILRLNDSAEVLAAFMQAITPIAQAGRLAPLLFQLPPHFKVDAPRLRSFVDEVAKYPVRTAWEFRDPSWFTPEIYSLLAKHQAALCTAESDTLATPDLATTPAFRVFRLRRSTYTKAQLHGLAKQFSTLARQGSEVYAFFMHEDEPTGPLRALEVLRQVPQELRA